MRAVTPPQTPNPDWRDPSMPVIRDYRFASGKHMTVVEPDFEQGFRGYMMSNSVQPNWRDDPTYNLRKKRR